MSVLDGWTASRRLYWSKLEPAMEDVDVRHAKEHLEELIERARRGEDVRIADPKGGSVRLTP